MPSLRVSIAMVALLALTTGVLRAEVPPMSEEARRERAALIVTGGVQSVKTRDVAEDVQALEVIPLAERYGAEGVSLRIEPSFPWDLA